MIKATLQTKDGQRLFIVGLSEMNLKLLRAGKPIQFDLAEMGGDGEMMIVWGETEGAIVHELAPHIGPATVVRYDRKCNAPKERT